MHIAHVAPEMAPLAKVGGLGDVVGSLPRAQAEAGHEVTVVLPGYRAVLDRLGLRGEAGRRVAYRIDGAEIVGAALEIDHAGVRLIALQHDGMFDRGGIYGDDDGSYGDNGERFAWFCGAALEALRSAQRPPQAIIAHDWPAALTPVFLRFHPRPHDPLAGTASLQVIHNLAHQGVFPLDLARKLALPESWLDAELLEALGSLNMLKGGVLCATKVVTVSPTYAEEIVWPALGEGLDGALLTRGEDLTGILNGIDQQTWNPASDPFLPAPYDARRLAGKAQAKAALQRRIGLGVARGRPLFGVVSRIDPQKGIDLVEAVAPWLVEQQAQLVVLGTGRPGLLEPLHHLAEMWRESVAVIERFDEELAHLIYGGADFFLMPSRFEPCGLGQMVSLRYGTPPIVRRTGGLSDTVKDLFAEPSHGTGFVFDTPDAAGLRWACEQALTLFRKDSARLRRVRQRAMRQDYSWNHSAREYDRLLGQAVRRESRRVVPPV